MVLVMRKDAVGAHREFLSLAEVAEREGGVSGAGGKMECGLVGWEWLVSPKSVAGCMHLGGREGERKGGGEEGRGGEAGREGREGGRDGGTAGRRGGGE